MPRPERKTKRYAFGCGLVAAILAAAWLLLPRERLLLDIARPVCRIDSTSNRFGTPKEKLYWLTSSLLLIITTEYEGWERKDNRWRGHAELYDTSTHSRTLQGGLTNPLNRPGQYPWRQPTGFQLSPTGARVYWLGYPQHTNGVAVAATLYGKEHREWPLKGGIPRFWIDDQHFVDMTLMENAQSVQLKIHDTRSADGDRTIMPSSEETSTLLARVGQYYPLTSFVADTGKGYVDITMSWLDIKTLRTVQHTNKVIIPEDAELIECEDQPHPTTVPFLLKRSETPLALAWLHRLFRSVSVKPVVTEGLWVSRAHAHAGERAQEIGHVPIRLDRNNRIEGDQLEQVLWLPGGNQLSFIYKGMLYIVPIKPSN